ncbi:unnamed protein product [Rotaria magnacalcarata]|uniref:Uncharacterized protein n=1 Tax=Rotaria magnacalcarata TaxID=392030 RepID=A0A814EHS3_9BILA|nr:unnamed protein product [Rotaria magnacalcarata]CAF1211303.1 unnamed protein product [Rotaria magnacalcarata]CAF3746271.1 unnamed protein product [Rotaria magnacalcarata]CAF3791988.1 unnamed protein product [Rotaria magnacalcarata]
MAASSTLVASMDGGGGLNASGTGGVEIAKALSTMQIRNEQFRQLYEQLKKEYSTLSDAYADCQRALEKSSEDNRQMQEKFKNLLDKLQMENRKKQTQIEEMKTQLIDNSKIDQIRDRLSSEVEGPYKLALSQLGNQLEQTKAELTKVRFEFNARIKEHSSELSQRDQIASEIQLKTEKELVALRKERDLLQQHIRQEYQKDSNIEQNRSKETTQLKAKIEQLIQELNESREVKLHAEQTAAATQRELLKERSLSKTNSSLIENERDSLKQQLAATHHELTSISEQLTSTNRQIHEKDLRIAQISSDYENIQHRLKVEVANHKIDLAKIQREQLEQHEQLKIHIQELEENIVLLTSDKAKLQLNIQEKEHNLLTSVQATREDEWKKISEITNEKLNLEADLNILKKSNDEKQKQFEIERDRLYEQTRSLEKTRDELTKENVHLNTTIKQMNDCQNEFEREQEKSRELYRKCVKLESQLSSTNGIEQELTEINLKLKNELNQIMNECHSNKQEFQQMNNQCTTTIENARRAFFNERKEMEIKIEQLVEQLKKYKTKIIEMQREKKEYRLRYQNFSQKLIEKSQLIETKLNEIKQKELSLQNVVSLQTHNRLKRQLSQLLRKHSQFQTILDANNTNPTSTQLDDKYNLNSMLTRLDRLSHEQNHQLNDFIPTKESSLTFSNNFESNLNQNGIASSSPDKRKTIIRFEEENN